MVRELSIEKRERFLTSALKLFVLKGVQNTTTADITRDAGTAAGTLFLYFPTKQDLVNELVLMISKQEADTINRLLEPAMSIHDAFYTIWSRSIRWLLKNMDAYLFNQQIRDSGLIPTTVIQETGKHFRFFYETIQRGLDEGRIKPMPIELIGGFLYQDIVAVMNHLRLQADPQKQEEAILQGFTIFWDGISIQKES